MKARFFSILLLLASLPFLAAAEYSEGRIKLVLHENTGRFSLYYMADLINERYESLFTDQDPRTSFLTLMSGDRAYRLGDALSFKVRPGPAPSLIFESSAFLVTQSFSFIKTAASAVANGVRMDVRIENKGEPAPVGLRFLLDTSLGEGVLSTPHFTTDLRSFSEETLIDREREDKWWISQNGRFGFMGTIFAGVTEPDMVQFANWKRFNDVPWKTDYSAGRNFNLLPYSINDSAVCYYFDPAPLARGESRTFSVLLAAADEKGFIPIPAASPAAENIAGLLEQSAVFVSAGEDLRILQALITRIDECIAAQSISDEELVSVELILARLKARYQGR
jgi:hypothetical protein